MSRTLRLFIRESLVVEIGGSPGQDIRYRPTTLPVTEYKPLLGDIGTFATGGLPDYIVVAVNPGLNQAILKTHSKSSAGPSEFRDLIDAKIISSNDPVINNLESAKTVRDSDVKSVKVNSQGWFMIDTDKSEFDDALLQADTLEPSIKDYYIVTQANKLKIDSPQREYTRDFYEDVASFRCALDLDDVVLIVKTKDVKDPEWVLAAACFYDYANSFSVSIISTIGGAIFGAGFGALSTLWTGAGALVGAGAGAELGATAGAIGADLALRGLAMYWAAKNGKWTFFWANAIYIAVIVSFGIATAGIGSNILKLSPPALKSLLIRTFTRLGAAGINMTKKSKILDLVMDSPKKALTEYILNFASTVFADMTMIPDNAQVRETVDRLIEDPTGIDQIVNDSRAQLQYYIKSQYPIRE